MSRWMLLGCVWAGLVCLGNSAVRADAMVTHVYDLNGSFADSLGGPSLVPNGGMLGTSGYTFGFGQGPSLSGAINPGTYSIEMLFRLNDLSGFRKLLDFKDRTSDIGLYSGGTALNFFNVAAGPAGSFAPDTLHHLIVTRDDATDQFTGFVDSVQRVSFVDGGNLAVFSAANGIIQFLRDDLGGGENPNGFLDRVRIYDGVLTPAQVNGLFVGGDPPGLPAVSAPEPSSLALFCLCLSLSLAIRRWK